MVRPVLEYSSTVWDPHLARDTHALEQVQRRAARFVHRNYSERTPGCVTNMVQSGMGILPVLTFCRHALCVFQKSSMGLLTSVLNLFNSTTVVLQDHIAYANFRPLCPFYPRTTSDWNRLPTAVTDLQTLQGFREGLAHLPPSLRPLYQIQSSLYIVLTGDLGNFVCFIGHRSFYTGYTTICEESYLLNGRRKI